MEKDKVTALSQPLPQWALKPHPAKNNMTVIHPMAVIDRLNEVFGTGEWKFETEYIACNPAKQKTKSGERDVFMSAVKGRLIVPKHDILIEQFGGNTNDDMGDALKGGATDALTKIASYLGVGASVYKGQGNVGPEMAQDDAFKALRGATNLDELKAKFTALPAQWQKDTEVVALKDELKSILTTI